MSYGALANDQIPSAEEINNAITATSLPTGPKPSLAQVDPGLPSGVDATWTNTSSTLGIEIEWWVNDSVVQIRTLTAGTTSNHLGDCNDASPPPNCENLADGDKIEARIRYRAEGDEIVGSVLDGGQDMHRNDHLNARLEMDTNLTPDDAVADKGEIEAARKRDGDFGAMSDPLTYGVV